MEFNFSPVALIDAGGGFLFLLVGLAILALAWRSTRGRLIGGLAASFGLAYVVQNLIRFDADVGGTLVVAPPAVVAAALAIALVRHLSADLTPGARRRLTVLCAGLAVPVGLFFAGYAVRTADRGVSESIVFLDNLAYAGVLQPVLVVLLAVCVLPLRAGRALAYPGRLLLGLSFGLFQAYINAESAAVAGTTPGLAGALIDASGVGIGIAAAIVAGWLIASCPADQRRLGASAFAAVMVVMLTAILVSLRVERFDYGIFGIIRSVGTVLLVLAIARHDILQVPLPRLVVRRGALAGGALAVLFIVAQVAQNFFSAEYGLLTGGVIAGTFLFAASPVQRAIERSSGHPKPHAAALGSAASGYKAALRAAMRDGTLTRREERHLAEVAMALGISAVQALDLRDEVEREHT